MNGTVRLCAIVSLLVVVGLGVAATGGATATGAAEYCDEVDANDSVVFGGVGADATSYHSDDRTVYANSTLTVGYCEGGESAERDWLTVGDGFDKGDREGHTYDVRFTGETDSVDFAEHVAGNQSGGALDALEVTIVEADDDEFDNLYDQFQAHATETENATAELEQATSELEDGTGDVGDANETLHTLQDHHTNMMNARSDLLGTLKSESQSGNVTGAVGTAAQLDAEYNDYDGSVSESADAYTQAVEAAGSGAQSTLQLSVFGSIGAGVVVGLLVGAVVPLMAARRVKEKMKLSRDVNYDRKVALLPILVGVVLALAGVAVLVFRVGAESLFRVIV